jgi:hypothetical protein
MLSSSSDSELSKESAKGIGTDKEQLAATSREANHPKDVSALFAIVTLIAGLNLVSKRPTQTLAKR